jgi:hypothetical protein
LSILEKRGRGSSPNKLSASSQQEYLAAEVGETPKLLRLKYHCS